MNFNSDNHWNRPVSTGTTCRPSLRAALIFVTLISGCFFESKRTADEGNQEEAKASPLISCLQPDTNSSTCPAYQGSNPAEYYCRWDTTSKRCKEMHVCREIAADSWAIEGADFQAHNVTPKRCKEQCIGRWGQGDNLDWRWRIVDGQHLSSPGTGYDGTCCCVFYRWGEGEDN